jgi:hypothetical protein
MAAPILAAVGVITALVSESTIEIEKAEDEGKGVVLCLVN